jgi:hypothetical protein
MTMRAEQWILIGSVALASGSFFLACGGSEKRAETGTKDSIAGQIGQGDEKSRCDYKGRTDREVQETAGTGAFQPNIRRVFALVGSGDDLRRVLLCREVDSNLDGVKDVVRTYTDTGEALHELADANYDGKVDTWVTFARGRIAKVQVDNNSDQNPDESSFYLSGKLSRLQRDRNYDGKPDVWEIYDEGRLQRMGVDLDFDGHVDRWDRDQILARAEDQDRPESREQPDTQGAAADAGASDAALATDAYVGTRKR